MTDFRNKIIRPAYVEILGREGDEGGVNHYNELMNGRPPRTPETRMTEAEMRESLIRSPEFAEKNPEAGPPPPPPPPGTMSPLRVEGPRFVAGGSPIELLGMILCCCSPAKCGTPEDEALVHGWPSTIDVPALDMMRANRLNWCHVRMGPFRVATPGVPDSGELPENVAYADAGGGRVDLNRWNSGFFSRLRTFLGNARDRGIYVEIDLIDAWVLDHEVGPWSADANVNGINLGSIAVYDAPPRPVHEAWVRKIVQETRDFENVTYHTGNELWKAKRRAAIGSWVQRMADIVREETGTGARRRLLGDNSDTRHAAADYWTYHSVEAQQPDEKPVMVNEYPSQPPHVVVAEVARARALGTVFHYWRGGHTWEETEDVCRRLKTIIDGGQPFPDSCPVLVRWQPKVHIVMNKHRQMIESGIPEEEGFVFFDSTPRYGSGNGRPCNAEHNEVCGGRPCEDPRGGRWTLIEGNAQVRIENPGDNGFGFQALLGPLGPAGSRYTLRIEALPDARDGLGKPLNVHPNHARTVTVVVGESTRSASALAMVTGKPDPEEESFRPVPAAIKTWMEQA